MRSIKQVLIERDGMTEIEAEELIKEATEDLQERIATGEDAFNICEEYFGLEPDYLDKLLF